MSSVSKVFEAATPRFINSHSEFIYVFMGVPVLPPRTVILFLTKSYLYIYGHPYSTLLCYWAAKKLGISMTEIANRLGLTQPAVSIAARRGEEIATKNGYSLFDE